MASDPAEVACDEQMVLTALPGLPIIEPGDDVGTLLCDALERARIAPRTGRDVLVVTSKVISRAEGCFVDLNALEPSARAQEVATLTDKDPRLVELILRESESISRAARGVLIVRHRLGFISANAGVDESNARHSQGADEEACHWVLTLPRDPDASAAALRAEVRERFDADVGVVITDSHGRPFRVGTVGTAIGVSGLPALWDQRGDQDLHGRTLQVTVTALADQVAAAADLVAGQGGEGRAVVHVSGLRFRPVDESARALLRLPDQDLYA